MKVKWRVIISQFLAGLNVKCAHNLNPTGERDGPSMHHMRRA